MRDYQRKKVYDWERAEVFPKMPRSLRPVTELKMVSDFIWEEFGFVNGPRLMVDTAYKVKSTGNRYVIRFEKSMTNEAILAHELGHSMNLREDDKENFDWHGPNYVADYCSILIRFYGFDKWALVYSLSKANVQVNMSRLDQNLMMEKENGR